MEIERIKEEITEIQKYRAVLTNSLKDIEYADICERVARKIIVGYCESKGYEVDGFPFQKRILGETDEYYDEDYFCMERYLKYIDMLAATKEDVLEIKYFYIITFWPDFLKTKEEFKIGLLNFINMKRHNIEF